MYPVIVNIWIIGTRYLFAWFSIVLYYFISNIRILICLQLLNTHVHAYTEYRIIKMVSLFSNLSPLGNETNSCCTSENKVSYDASKSFKRNKILNNAKTISIASETAAMYLISFFSFVKLFPITICSRYEVYEI